MYQKAKYILDQFQQRVSIPEILFENALISFLDDLEGVNNKNSFINQNLWAFKNYIFIRAIFTPILQLVYSRILLFINKIEKPIECEYKFFSFLKSHTDILIPVFDHMNRKSPKSVQFIRASIGMNDLIDELNSFQKKHKRKVCLLELYYGIREIIAYFTFIIATFGEVRTKIIRDNKLLIDIHELTQIPLVTLKINVYKLFVYYIPLSYLMTLISKKIISPNSNAMVFGYDNCTRGRSLVYQAKLKNIFTLSIQHGIIASPERYIPVTNKMIVWSVGEKKKLLSQNVEQSKILAWGSPKYDFTYCFTPRYNSTDRKKIILSLTRSIPDEIVYADIKNLCEYVKENNNVLMVIRPHPLENKPWLENFKNLCHERIQIIRHGNFEDLLGDCDLGVMYFSSVMVDFVIRSIPVVSLLKPNMSDPTNILKESKILKCYTKDQLWESVHMLLYDDEKKKKYINDQNSLISKLIGTNNSPIKKIVKLLEQRL